MRKRVKGILKNLPTGEGTSATSTAIILLADPYNSPAKHAASPAGKRDTVFGKGQSALGHDIRGMRAHGVRTPRICAASFRKLHLPSSLVPNEALRYESTRVETCASVDNHTQSNWITPTTSLPPAVPKALATAKGK